ncbi:hypothetical protein [Pseudomonas sp. BIGb0164]|uniref:hypothetical protein n=1 Tax=Pseudomonas sp. BIGb0164 TaxID=2940605 RepID=UPI0021692FA2|nr:hypothetical protein [Pseudomonas sp. BIGb0164]MCS4248488.1 hypothetical protein [Pseudomonas sp. BIGb0164]
MADERVNKGAKDQWHIEGPEEVLCRRMADERHDETGKSRRYSHVRNVPGSACFYPWSMALGNILLRGLSWQRQVREPMI